MELFATKVKQLEAVKCSHKLPMDEFKICFFSWSSEETFCKKDVLKMVAKFLKDERVVALLLY